MTRLTYYRFVHLEAKTLGESFVAPSFVVFSQFDLAEPDLICISKESSEMVIPRNVIGAPDLKVEALPEGTAQIDRNAMLKPYPLFDVREYWMVDPEGPAAEIYRPGAGGLQLGASLS